MPSPLPNRSICRAAALAIALLALAKPPNAWPRRAAAQEGVPAPAIVYLSGDHVDYATSGVPDFSQCRAGWDRPAPEPGLPGQWTHAAPVALADVLWWLDSRAEPSPRDPAAANDGHPLITAYPAFGPRRDDHAVENLPPLIADLAGRVNTDGRRRPSTVRGSRWEDVVEGATAFVTARAGAHYTVSARDVPDSAWLAEVRARGGSAVLALGVWEQQGSGWARIGGHYAALAGADRAGEHVALADPLADRAAEGSAGRTVPEAPSEHSCRNNPRAHDDAGVVAHDVYALFPPPGLLGGRLALGGYFTPESFGEGAAFAGLNPIEALEAHAGPWQRGVLVMAIDAAVAVLPRVAPTEPASATPFPTETATPAPPTATTSPEEPTATAGPSATAPSTPSATATARRRDRAWLPIATLGGLPRRPIVRPDRSQRAPEAGAPPRR